MKQPKWITKAEVVENDEPGYWVARGWDKVARMKATSVIGTIAVESAIQKDGQTLVPIGGIAHAGARRVSRVEFRVDDGAWIPAALRTPLSDLTWVVWWFDRPLRSGNHLFRVRCYDGAGLGADRDTPRTSPEWCERNIQYPQGFVRTNSTWVPFTCGPQKVCSDSLNAILSRIDSF
jgi:hypothetical protein